MAEQLVIRVKIDGMSGSEGSNKGRAGVGDGAGAIGLGAVANVLGKNQGPYPDTLKPRGKTSGNDYASIYKNEGWFDRKKYEEAGLEGSGYGEYGGKLAAFGTRRLVSDINQEQETAFGYGLRKTGDHFNANSARYKALGAGTAYKVVNSAINIHQHKSGNSYANAQINNTMKFASYGVALAMSGPLAPAVAAGIVINEIGNGVTSSINYSYDRKQDRNKAKNIAIVAGNMSYGRNRGGY